MQEREQQEEEASASSAEEDELDVDLDLEGESLLFDVRSLSPAARRSRRRLPSNPAPGSSPTTEGADNRCRCPSLDWRRLDPFQEAVTKAETASTLSLLLAAATLLCVVLLCVLSVLSFVRAPVLVSSGAQLLRLLPEEQQRSFSVARFTCDCAEGKMCLVASLHLKTFSGTTLLCNSTLLGETDQLEPRDCVIVLRRGQSMTYTLSVDYFLSFGVVENATISSAGAGLSSISNKISEAPPSPDFCSASRTESHPVGHLSSPGLLQPVDVATTTDGDPVEVVYILSLQHHLSGAISPSFTPVNAPQLKRIYGFPRALLWIGETKYCAATMTGPALLLYYLYIDSREYQTSSLLGLVGELGGICVGLWFSAAFLSYVLKRIFPRIMLSEDALNPRGKYRRHTTASDVDG